MTISQQNRKEKQAEHFHSQYTSASPLKKTYTITGLGCANCAAKMEKEINHLPGVHEAHVDFVNKRLTLNLKGTDILEETIQKSRAIVKRIENGADLLENRSENHEEDHSTGKSWYLVLGGVFFIVAFLLSGKSSLSLILYIISLLLIGGEIYWKALNNITKGRVFDENFLMAIASLGAFAIGEYAEGVAVMLFYQVGEFLQDKAVDRSRKSISSLMDIRPEYANRIKGGTTEKVLPELIVPGDLIIIKPGEKIPLDGVVSDGVTMLDTSALTGESLPQEVSKGSSVLSGAINMSGLLTVKVTKPYSESTVSKILDLVENASSKKAPTEKFITKFAGIYTPVVVIIALLMAVIPPLVIPAETFSQWIYRALVFLVISCPCALVISIPLGFFGGIGGASAQGILVKGGNYLEALNNVDTVVFDKTGTLTKGVFEVQKTVSAGRMTESELLKTAAYAESHSNHPIARSVLKAYNQDIDKSTITDFKEIAGLGINVTVKGKKILAGNAKLLRQENVSFPVINEPGTLIYIAVNGKYEGAVIISDQIKGDSKTTVSTLRKNGVRNVVMLTGDKKDIAEKIAQELGLDQVISELLPHEKVQAIEKLSESIPKGKKLLFAGDGINDAPVLARADIGVAMGGVGSDAAIEAADIVLMTDEPSKLVTAIQIAGKTRSIVWQNIVFALGVKAVVLVFGSLGIASMWSAVFADVGVALLAILNSLRVVKGK